MKMNVIDANIRKLIFRVCCPASTILHYYIMSEFRKMIQLNRIIMSCTIFKIYIMKKREGEYDISLVEIYTPEFLRKNVICN